MHLELDRIDRVLLPDGLAVTEGGEEFRPPHGAFGFGPEKIIRTLRGDILRPSGRVHVEINFTEPRIASIKD